MSQDSRGESLSSLRLADDDAEVGNLHLILVAASALAGRDQTIVRLDRVEDSATKGKAGGVRLLAGRARSDGDTTR